MKCFSHRTQEAFAVCKSCGRGLCAECIVEVNLSCACRDRCESDVAAINDLVQRGRSAYHKTSATYLRSGIFTLFLGLIFIMLGIGAVAGKPRSPADYFFGLMGVVFVGWAISHFVSARRMKQQ